MCGDEEKLSVDLISKPCLLELTQGEGGSLGRLDHPVRLLQAPIPALWLHVLKQKLLKHVLTTQIKKERNMGLEPRGQKAHCKLVSLSLWFPAPRGEGPQLSSSPDTAACMVCPPQGTGPLQGRVIRAPSCPEPQICCDCRRSRDAQINAKTAWY